VLTRCGAQTIRNLDFLEQWRDFLLPYHLIVIQARCALRGRAHPFRSYPHSHGASRTRGQQRSAGAPVSETPGRPPER